MDEPGEPASAPPAMEDALKSITAPPADAPKEEKPSGWGWGWGWAQTVMKEASSIASTVGSGLATAADAAIRIAAPEPADTAATTDAPPTDDDVATTPSVPSTASRTAGDIARFFDNVLESAKHVVQESEMLQKGREFATEMAHKGREIATEYSHKGREFATEAAHKGREFASEAAHKTVDTLENVGQKALDVMVLTQMFPTNQRKPRARRTVTSPRAQHGSADGEKPTPTDAAGDESDHEAGHAGSDTEEDSVESMFRHGNGGKSLSKLEALSTASTRQVMAAISKLPARERTTIESKLKAVQGILNVSDAQDAPLEWDKLLEELKEHTESCSAALGASVERATQTLDSAMEKLRARLQDQTEFTDELYSTVGLESADALARDAVKSVVDLCAATIEALFQICDKHASAPRSPVSVDAEGADAAAAQQSRSAMECVRMATLLRRIVLSVNNEIGVLAGKYVDSVAALGAALRQHFQAGSAAKESVDAHVR
eukprot:TRINITY_DN5434_c0_g1_i2.p1 TRINITY_DN5434_c0_g1~~TRINITY_DN5434_c0_g1_i2.p1  ORF type:complete len:491 (-),score=129.05 TRINITY_DN5434_c0_g1_i2:302-1774(-)